MSIRVACLLIGLLWFSVVTQVPAYSDECYEREVTRFVNGQLKTVVVRVCSDAAPGVEPTSGESTPDIPTAAGIALCLMRARLSGADLRDVCYDTDQDNQQVTAAAVAEAFRVLPLPSSTLVVQPPNGRTMVNFDTNFFTQRAPFTRTVRLLGQRVNLRIQPAEFTWEFGDGESLTTTTPGAPYPDLLVTHDYLTADTFAPRVDTTYTAEWQVGGGAWQAVPGSVTIPGASVALETVEVDLKLVY